MKRLTIITLLLLLGVHAAAFDFPSGIGYGLGGAVMISRPSASAMLQLPAAVPPPRSWQIEMSFTRQYELADLDQLQFVVSNRWRQLAVAVGFAQFGKSELYQEQTAIGTIAYHWRAFTVGGSMQYQWLKFGGGYDGLSTGTFALSGSWFTRLIRLGFSADNLTEPSFVSTSPSLPVQYRGYLELAPNATQTILARVKAEVGHAPQWVISQRFRLAESGAVMWHLSTKPWKFGGAVELGYNGSLISYAAAYHPDLGLTHTVAVGYGRSGFVQNEHEH